MYNRFMLNTFELLVVSGKVIFQSLFLSIMQDVVHLCVINQCETLNVRRYST